MNSEKILKIADLSGFTLGGPDCAFTSARLENLLHSFAFYVEREILGCDLSLNDYSKVLKTLKYIQGIAEHGERREKDEDEPLEIFILNYIKRLEAEVRSYKNHIVTPSNVGKFCLNESECIKTGINFADYKRGLLDAAQAFARNKSESSNALEKLEKIALIAHCSGLACVNENEAHNLIQDFTFEHIEWNMTQENLRHKLNAALAAAKKA